MLKDWQTAIIARLSRHATHLHPTAELAPRALLPGDPGRALALAQELLSEPRMFNHNRGLWGYTGVYADGEPMTIQATGIGGPSTAVVVAELAELGLRRAIRVGTATALEDALALGELLVVERALCADGTSAALGAVGEVGPQAALLAALRAAAPAAAAGTVASGDLFYEERAELLAQWRARDARAREMAAAAFFALAAGRGVDAACVVVISARQDHAGAGLKAEALAEASLAAGRVAAAALAV